MTITFDRMLIIIPCRNESDKFKKLINSLEMQSVTNLKVIFAINNSTDDSQSIASGLESDIEIIVDEISGSGSLFSAAEYSAFISAAEKYFMYDLSYSHVMKLDADILLDPQYFINLFSNASGVGVCGGPLPNEQSTQICGGVKLYSRSAYEVIRQIPTRLGFDIVDELYILKAGLPVEIINECKFTLVRKTGISEGKLRGMYRNGKACRRVGYGRIYFILKLLRFSVRRPIIIGSIAMAFGYIFDHRDKSFDFVKGDLRGRQWSSLTLFLKSPRIQFKKMFRD